MNPTDPLHPRTPRVPADDQVVGDSGITLIEMTVALTVMAIAMSIFTTGIVQIFRTTSRVESLSSSQSQVQTAFDRLDREVRYASAISDPVTGADSYVEYLMATTGTNTCVELRMRSSTGQLQRRTWLKDAATVTPTAWTLLASSVSATTPFIVTPADSVLTSPTLQVNLKLTVGLGSTAAVRETRLSVAALNASTDTADPDVCTDGRSIP